MYEEGRKTIAFLTKNVTFFSLSWHERKNDFICRFCFSHYYVCNWEVRETNTCQLCVHISKSSRLKNVFPDVIGQFQISPMEFQFQLPNESKSRQKNTSINKMCLMSYKLLLFFLPPFLFLYLQGLLFPLHMLVCCTKQTPWAELSPESIILLWSPVQDTWSFSG